MASLRLLAKVQLGQRVLSVDAAIVEKQAETGMIVSKFIIILKIKYTMECVCK